MSPSPPPAAPAKSTVMMTRCPTAAIGALKSSPGARCWRGTAATATAGGRFTLRTKTATGSSLAPHRGRQTAPSTIAATAASICASTHIFHGSRAFRASSAADEWRAPMDPTDLKEWSADELVAELRRRQRARGAGGERALGQAERTLPGRSSELQHISNENL